MPSLRSLFPTLLICVFGVVPAAGDDPFTKTQLGQLINEGIGLSGETVFLSSPEADPRLSAEELAEGQKLLAGPREWDAFTRKSVVAPVQINLAYLKNSAGKRIGLRTHFAFVVHANVSQLRDDESLRKTFADEAEESKQEGFRSEPIASDALADLGISETDGSAYGWLETVLLNKIAIGAVIQSQQVSGPQYQVTAWKLDDRFTDRDPPHPQYRNEWHELRRDDLGRETSGPATPYAGAAGYLIVTQLVGDDQASMIEGEVIVHEPEAWFSGSNLLRSKVPLIIQESVRKLRRGLE